MSLSHEHDNTTPATQQQQNEQPDASENKTPLGLPPPPSDEAGTTKLNVGGQAVKLDHLGPLVVNKDGTLSRIANWEHMTDIEKQNTLRILVKRNQIRTEALKESLGGEGQSDEGQAK
jgi:hypothetical protein